MYTAADYAGSAIHARRSSLKRKVRVATGARHKYDWFMNYDDVRSQLSRTPGVLTELLRNASGRVWTATEGPGTWSPLEVVCHLLHGEDDDWIPRVRTIVEHGGGTPFTPFDREAGM